MNREEALEKIRSLLEVSNHTNTNVNEAATAAGMAQKLMTKYQITSLMLQEESDSEEDEEEIIDFGAKGAPLDEMRRLEQWRKNLADAVCRANTCRVYWYKGCSIEIIGRPSDAETVRYMYMYLAREIDRLAKTQGKGCGRKWSLDFRIGAVEAIDQRLQEAVADAKKAAYVDAAQNSNALVLVDRSLARLDQRKQELTEWVKQNMKIKSSKHRYNVGADAYYAGVRAGQTIDLGSAKGKLAGGGKRLGSGNGEEQ